MLNYLLRRLWQSALTVVGVMLITFVLFRQIAGDVSASFVNQKLGREARVAFYEKHKLDRPAFFNFHRRLRFDDHTSGPETFAIADRNGSSLAQLLELHLPPAGTTPGESAQLVGQLVFSLNKSTPVLKLTKGKAWFTRKAGDSTAAPSLAIMLSNGTTCTVAVDSITSCDDLFARVADATGALVTGSITSWSLGMLFDSQLFWHLWESVTFSGRSFATDQSLLEIIRERGKFSLALTLPMLSLGWIFGLALSCFVAYFRDTWIDRIGVLLAVLGMCIPYLAYMLIGQWFLFKIAPSLAAGLSHPGAVFIPVFIAVFAGLGSSVRFYRTIILDQINQDYVRTARAKGVGLSSILFKHVLRNSMLPILTNLVSSIPFLIMGSLLLERFFGIPGLGDLMMTSIYSRDVPIITGLTFLTAVLYVLSLLATDLLYAVFDPRVKLH